jgi:hypothetical protein
MYIYNIYIIYIIYVNILIYIKYVHILSYIINNYIYVYLGFMNYVKRPLVLPMTYTIVEAYIKPKYTPFLGLYIYFTIYNIYIDR